MQNYPARIGIEPYPFPIQTKVTVPGSKSITNRALILAAMNAPVTACVLSGALRSEDTEVMVTALRELGWTIQEDWQAANPSLTLQALPANSESLIPKTQADLFVANSGTSMRFLTALTSLGKGMYRLDGIPRMRERPIGDLIEALAAAGIAIESEMKNACPPVQVQGNGLNSWYTKQIPIRANLSSQFLSALLMTLPLGNPKASLMIDGPCVSEPYVEMTLKMCEQFGYQLQRNGQEFTFVQHLQKPNRYRIEPDASAASYFLAIPAIIGGSLTITGLNRNSLQGDIFFADALAQMGCMVEWNDDSITIQSGHLRGIEIDMNAISDTVMTLAAVACFAEGPTTIRNVAHIRHKETDRIGALATELRKTGIRVEEFNDGLKIHPSHMQSATFDTYNDHRMAMSLALLGLRVPGIMINQPGCVAKTYPGFWQDFEAIRRRR